MTIDGSNDTPVIDQVIDGDVEENSAVAGNTIATVLASDVDSSDAPTYSIISVEGDESGSIYDYFDINTTSGAISLSTTGAQAVNDSEINDFTFDIVVRASDDETPTAAFTEDTVTVTITDSILTTPTLTLNTVDDTGVQGDDLTDNATPTLDIGAIDDDVMSVTITDSNGDVYLDSLGRPATATRADIDSPWVGTNPGLVLNLAGEWSYTFETLADGEHTFGVVLTDDGGNTTMQMVTRHLNQFIILLT